MAGLELVLLLLAVSAALRVAAERLRIPYASLLVVGGLLLAFVPGLPRVTFPPEALFLVFVPPLHPFLHHAQPYPCSGYPRGRACWSCFTEWRARAQATTS